MLSGGEWVRSTDLTGRVGWESVGAIKWNEREWSGMKQCERGEDG